MGRLIKSFRLISTHRQAPAFVQLETVIRQALVQEVWTTALEEVGRVCDSVISSFVKCGCGKMHAVADRTVDVLPLHEWKTECGWTFGLADFPSVQVR